MRILDRYILSRFLLNFISSFAILLFIFIFQAIWLFVDEWAGKDLDLAVMAKFLWNLIPTLLDKVILFTVLLSSILTFGNFAENYEFAAMKASGVSLIRSMRSLTVFSIILGLGTFMLANYVTPKAEKQIFNMRTNLKDIKPASVIVEGVFSDIQGSNMNMMVAEKYGKDDSKLKNIIIHQKSRRGINTTVIRAETGELLGGDDDSGIVQLILYNGYYYEEVQPSSSKEQRKHPFARANFKTYVKNIDLSSLSSPNIDDDRGIVTDKMKSIERLYRDIDSLEKTNLEQIRAFSRTSNLRLGAFPLRNSSGKDSVLDPDLLSRQRSGRMSHTTGVLRDSTGGAIEGIEWASAPDTLPDNREALASAQDSAKSRITEVSSLLESLPYWKQEQVYRNAENNVQSLFNTVDAKKANLKVQRERYNRHLLSLHKKFALAFSCVILFFIGAPLGAIIKKGGVGFPMVIAFLLFIVYYFLGVAAENFAKKGNMEPILGAWLSTLVMLPLSVVLTHRANRDKQFAGINTGFSELFKMLRPKSATPEEGESTAGFPGPETLLSIEIDKEVREQLAPLTDTELRVYAMKQYEQNNSWDPSLPALRVLSDREADLSELRREYLFRNAERQRFKKLRTRFNRFMPVLLLSFVLTLVSYVLKIAEGSGTRSAIYLFLGIFAVGVYLLTFLELLRTLAELHHTRSESPRPVPALVLLASFFTFPAFYRFITRRVQDFMNS